jgi:hypothetical protein
MKEGDACVPDPDCPVCVDVEAAQWQLLDIQPESEGYLTEYGLYELPSEVTVMALLVGWWGYCVSQAGKLQEMKTQLEAEGHTVQFVLLHGSNANTASSQETMVGAVSFPVFQDTTEVDAWGLHGGGKDDIYVFRSDRTLSAYLPHGGAVSTTLSSETGWDNVLNAVMAALEESEALTTDWAGWRVWIAEPRVAKEVRVCQAF